MRGTVILLALGVAACAPRLYERQVPVLEGRMLEDYTIRHDQAGDCLMRHVLPVSYEVKRPRYALRIVPAAGYGGEPLSLEVVVRGEGLSASAEGAALRDEGSPEAGVRRYRLSAEGADERDVRLDVVRGGETLGSEYFRLSAERCRALLWTND